MQAGCHGFKSLCLHDPPSYGVLQDHLEKVRSRSAQLRAGDGQTEIRDALARLGHAGEPLALGAGAGGFDSHTGYMRFLTDRTDAINTLACYMPAGTTHPILGDGTQVAEFLHDKLTEAGYIIVHRTEDDGPGIVAPNNTLLDSVGPVIGTNRGRGYNWDYETEGFGGT